MSRYDSFNDFMSDVVRIANETQDLNKLFDITNEEVVTIVQKIIRKGWWVLIAVAALLSLSAPGFLAATIAFLSNPAGLVVVALFGLGAAASLRVLYRNKKFPLAIKDVGSEYKPKYEAILSDFTKQGSRQREIDDLAEKAVISLISKAKYLSNQERLDLEQELKKKMLIWK